MRTQEITLYRRSSEEGYLNNNNEWVEATFIAPTSVSCNVQPFNQGKSKIILPDGVRTDSVKVIRTFTPLRVADHITGEEGDEVEYKGFRYEVFREEDWNGFGLQSDHYKYYIKRKDEV